MLTLVFASSLVCVMDDLMMFALLTSVFFLLLFVVRMCGFAGRRRGTCSSLDFPAGWLHIESECSPAPHFFLFVFFGFCWLDLPILKPPRQSPQPLWCPAKFPTGTRKNGGREGRSPRSRGEFVGHQRGWGLMRGGLRICRHSIGVLFFC